MKTKETTAEKRMYYSPAIEQIKLDNEISLALESSPPAGPGEASQQVNTHFNNDFFKSRLG